ncbi:MAG TPA: hypothetical protein ENN73_02290, partial [Firmicutes bacterium]|nr:hypothetical protein [Bacillota bacterium]
MMIINEPPKFKRGITSKILISLLFLSMLTVLIISIFSLVTLNNLGSYSVERSQALGDQVINDSINVL